MISSVQRPCLTEVYFVHSKSTEKKKRWVSHTLIIFLCRIQKKLLVVETEKSQFPSHTPTLIYVPALGAINKHFIVTLITQIHLYCHAAVALLQD